MEEVPEYWQGPSGPAVLAARSRAGRRHVCGQALRGPMAAGWKGMLTESGGNALAFQSLFLGV